MPKFRTMRPGTPEVATHLLTDNQRYITKIGAVLRRTSFDELPQLVSIIVGDMSFVGPRPALHNQSDLISLRTKCGVHKLTPGLTGLAQIRGRDLLSVRQKVRLDAFYAKNSSIFLDCKIVIGTFCKVFLIADIRH